MNSFCVFEFSLPDNVLGNNCFGPVFSSGFPTGFPFYPLFFHSTDSVLPSLGGIFLYLLM
jgi:hypothetical protein